VTTAPLRVGIVGAGWAGARHANSLRTFGVSCTPADATHSLALARASERALASGGPAAVRSLSAQRAEALP